MTGIGARTSGSAVSGPEAGSSARPFLRLASVGKRFGSGAGTVDVLSDITLGFERRRFVSLVGHSGCGKSTLLRIIAGLESVSAGEVSIDGMTPEVFGRDRPVGFVFQDSGLFAWKTALENVRLPLDVMGIESPAQRDRRARDFLRLVHLTGAEDRYPSQLSGGMRQRAAIARALCYHPELLLMDEPFGALDDFTRRELGDELLRIHAEQQCSVLFVTHSLSEAVLLSDQVVVLKPRPGRVAAVIDIDLPRPRDGRVRQSAAFRAHVDQLEEMIFGGDA